MSYISTESMEIVRLEARNHRVKEAAGACLFGSDTRRWPASWVDIVAELELQRILLTNARAKAETRNH